MSGEVVYSGDKTKEVDLEVLGDAPVAPGSVEPEGYRHDPSSFAFAPEVVQYPYARTDDSYLSSYPVADASGVGRETGVDAIASKDAAELCKMIDVAKQALVTRFKAFLAKTFNGATIDIDFDNLNFSSTIGERGSFLIVSGLRDQNVHVGEEDVLFSNLCVTEGLRVTPIGSSGEVFELGIPSDIFERKPVSESVRPGFEPTRVVRVPSLTSTDPEAIAGNVQARMNQVVSRYEAPTRRVVTTESNDESQGFLPE